MFMVVWQCFKDDLPRQQWSLLNRFRTEQGHCGVCRRKWRLTDTDLCPCGETQTMSHIVESCPLTKLNGGLSQLHYADEDAVSWLTSYGSWHTYEKKKAKTASRASIFNPLSRQNPLTKSYLIDRDEDCYYRLRLPYSKQFLTLA